MKYLFIIVLVVLISCDKKTESNHKNELSFVYDSHVHLMSPGLISYWKGLGIPFSRTAANYSNIDTILDHNKAQKIDLIGMAYVYGNPEYYEGNDVYKKVVIENDYLFETSKKHPDRVRPFFAIDPLKGFALDELERCYKIDPMSGLKLHFNASQVYLTEPEHLKKIKPIFKKAAEYNLPILLHFDNWHPAFGQADLELLVDSILTIIPPLKLRIAHFGTSGGFNEKTKRFINAYLTLKHADRIPDKHQILFDISAVALDKDSEGVSKLSKEQFEELRIYIDKIGMENIIFGTDYPLYNSEEYINVLKNHLNFTDQELLEINKK